MNNNLLNKTLMRHAVISFIFVCVAGTLLHFLYDWTGRNEIIGFISGVSESTWEHMKLMFVPMLLYAVFLWIRYRKTFPSVFPAFAIAALIGVFLIPVFYYTYVGILGFTINFLNILIFYICALIASICFYRMALKYDLSRLNVLLFLIHIILAVTFIFFTYNSPNIGIFFSPV